MVKFKVGFTITPEVLFGIIAKVLPVEDLHIEQIVETPAPTQPTLSPDWNRDWKLAKPKHKVKKLKREPTRPMDLEKGINAIIIKLLRTGPCKAVELKEHLVAGGYSPNSVGSRLQNLEEHGIVEKWKDGTWRLGVTPGMREVVKEYHGEDEVE